MHITSAILQMTWPYIIVVFLFQLLNSGLMILLDQESSSTDQNFTK